MRKRRDVQRACARTAQCLSKAVAAALWRVDHSKRGEWPNNTVVGDRAVRLRADMLLAAKYANEAVGIAPDYISLGEAEIRTCIHDIVNVGTGAH